MHININPKLMYVLKVYRIKFYKLVFYNGDPERLEWLSKDVNFFAITPGVAQNAEGKKANYLFTIVENADSDREQEKWSSG